MPSHPLYARVFVHIYVLTLALITVPNYSAQAQPVRGVTDTEIVIGTVTDLSGGGALQGVNSQMLSAWCSKTPMPKAVYMAARSNTSLRIIRQSVSRAVQAMNKLLNSDNIFLASADGNTPMNEANMPEQFAKNVPNVFPLTAARSMYEPTIG